jgi:class 3 adenylate cyclase
MWAVMFTDLVDSTAQRARIGDGRADSLRREHDEIVASAVAAHRGVVVKGTGDGAMAGFSSAADAVAAGIAIQQGVERRNRDAREAIGLRVGISLGDLAAEGDDLHGMAANEAARLCGVAEHGDVVVSDVVKTVAGTRAECEFVDRAERTLKGLPEPVVTWNVHWDALVDEAPPLPSALAGARDAMALAGRTDELDVLGAAWAAARTGATRAVFVSGEPGIGKTRLVSECAQRANADGGLALLGHCDDELGVPFQPFAEMLDWYLAHVDDVVVGRYGSDLTRLSPRVGDRIAGAADPLRADPETEQYRLFDAVVSWVRELCAQQPLVLVVDDLHWASRPTLLLLRHVLTHCDDVALLVLVTYRDTDLDRQHPLASVLADFRRLPSVGRLVLSGIDDKAAADLVAQLGDVGLDDPAGFARLLRAETEGNPFFIGEVLRHLADTGALAPGGGPTTVVELGIPEGIREVLGQRLDRLGPEATDVLRAAAVIGREFDVAVLLAVSGHDEATTLATLERAVAARLVEEDEGDRYRFAHALVRSALEDEITIAVRLRLHVRVAEFLERTRPDGVSALAEHWLEASFAGDPAKAVAYARQAADEAIARGAFGEAATILTRATELARHEIPDPGVRRALAVDLGVAQRWAGDATFRTTLLDAAGDADEAGDDGALVRAAKGLSRGLWSSTFVVDDEKVDVMQRALASLDAAPAGVEEERARVLATLASELTFSPYEQRRRLIDEARRIARSSGDRELVIDVDASSVWTLWGDPTNSTAALEGLAQLRDDDEPTRRYSALEAQRIIAMIGGDLVTSVDLLERERLAVADVPFGLGRWQIALQDFVLTNLAGDLDESERLAQVALEIGLASGQPDAALVAAVQHDGIVEARDDEGSSPVVMRDFAASQSGAAGADIWRGALALRLAQRGDVAEAREQLRAERARGFGYFEWTVVSSGYWSGFAEAVILVRDHEAAAEVYRGMLRYQGLQNYPSAGSYGSVDRHLARLATLLGDVATAESHLAVAEAMDERLGAPLHRALTLVARAELVGASDPTDPRIRRLADEAVGLARDHGARGVEREVREGIDRIGFRS